MKKKKSFREGKFNPLQYIKNKASYLFIIPFYVDKICVFTKETNIIVRV
jgi:hypothetical protein